jgi:hypothetical protein
MNLACAAQERPSPPCRRGLPSCCFPTRPHCAQVTAPLLSVYSQRGRPPSTATSQRNQESCYLGDSGSVGRLDEAWAFSMRISVQRKRRQISPVAVSDDSQSPGHAHTHTHAQRVTSTIAVWKLHWLCRCSPFCRPRWSTPKNPGEIVRDQLHLSIVFATIATKYAGLRIDDHQRPDQTSKHVNVSTTV